MRRWKALLGVCVCLIGVRLPVRAITLTDIAAGVKKSEGHGASIGVYLYDTSDKRVLYEHNAHKVFTAASIIKLYILATVYWLNHQGRLPITRAVQTDMRDMIGVSDNGSANALAKKCGIAQVNAFITNQLHAEHTVLEHLIKSQPKNTPSNVTTPYDAAQQLSMLLFDPQFAANQKDIRNFLTLARWHKEERLVRYIPKDIPCYRKTGTLINAIHDVACIYNPKNGHYLLAAFFSEKGWQGANKKLSEQISHYLAGIVGP